VESVDFFVLWSLRGSVRALPPRRTPERGWNVCEGVGCMYLLKRRIRITRDTLLGSLYDLPASMLSAGTTEISSFASHASSLFTCFCRSPAHVQSHATCEPAVEACCVSKSMHQSRIIRRTVRPSPSRGDFWAFPRMFPPGHSLCIS